MAFSNSVIAQAGMWRVVTVYQSVEVSRPLMTRACPLKLRSRCFQAAMVLVMVRMRGSRFSRVQSVLPK